MSKTSKFFNELKNERHLNNGIIEEQNFKAFLDEFDFSQKKSPKTTPHSLKDMENMLIQKAHNLKIYHMTSSGKSEKTTQNFQKSENGFESSKKMSENKEKRESINYESFKKTTENKENREPILIEEREDFFSNSNRKLKKYQSSEKKGQDLMTNNYVDERERIWKRLQDDRKAEKMQRELIKKQKEEQEVLKLI